jgi:hypothetical protein
MRAFFVDVRQIPSLHSRSVPRKFPITLYGGSGNDYLFGNDELNLADGELDKIFGEDDDDHMYGEAIDEHDGGAGTDWFNEMPA